jgi:hypothetical protein
MKDEGVRTYASEKLAKWRHPQDCLCEALVPAQMPGVSVPNGGSGAMEWDSAVLKGLRSATDDEHAACAAGLLDRTDLADRAGLITALALVPVPAVEARIRAAAKSDADPAVRGAALARLHPSKNADDLAIATEALTAAEGAVRAGAAESLAGVEAASAQLAAATKDGDPTVRGAALNALRSVRGFAFADVACPLLATDPDPFVRAAAATSMKGTADPAMLACLRAHMEEKEESGEVRMAMLAAMRSSKAEAAADALCELIPGWTRMYVGEGPVVRESDVDIVEAQNYRDQERSYECVEKAVKKGGWNCWQKAYLQDYFRDMGGKVAVPRCDGGGGGGAASNEIVF